MRYLYYIILAVISYFLGNFSTARTISKIKNDDITKYGSGNPGTLNSWRVYGFWLGLLTFVLDMLKGLVPTLVASLTFNHISGCNAEIAVYVAGFSVVLGHIFPVIYKFKGGKGIATCIGIFFVINWKVALIAFLVMIIGMLFVKYASIFTIGFVVLMCTVELFLVNPANWINYLFISGILALVLFAHRNNIVRLIQGKENKTELLNMLIGIFKKKKAKQNVQEQLKEETNTEEK